MPHLSLAAATHTGLVRVGNEDSHHVGAHLVAVADGVGGMSAGDRASRMVIETLAGLDGPRCFADVRTALQSAVESANRRIAEELNSDPAIVAAGTTLTALVFADDEQRPELLTPAVASTSQAASSAQGAVTPEAAAQPAPEAAAQSSPQPEATADPDATAKEPSRDEPDPNMVLAHVGDSRCYRLRAGRFVQLTKDDTFVQMLVDLGAISPEQAHDHPQRSVVTRVLRGEPVEVYYAELHADPQDRYICLCSDGLPSAVATNRPSLGSSRPSRTRPAASTG
ncbi:PP2C family protein-serine/threonine phosphatase [Fodinicola feengrottensis]|uniref:PP2C family protein-serine/threonine phosphatase n=1 Tax=Fodinicola feengrottensis TaxID=435914 RepID=UPI0013D45858|nr:protein phosphatase 2C domain-containing protein [Fodinicola feengrottensis]